MDTYNKVIKMLHAKQHHEAIKEWHMAQASEMQGKDASEYEVTAIEFFANYMEMKGNLQGSLGDSLSELGLDGITFGDGPKRSTGHLQEMGEKYSQIAVLLRKLATAVREKQ